MRISNSTFSTEDFEMTHIGLFVSEEFIHSFLEEFVKIYHSAEEYKEQITHE